MPSVRFARRFRWYHFLIPAGVLLLPVLLFFLLQGGSTPPAVRFEGGRWVRDDGEYAGVEACRECHASIVEQQLASSHAQTIRPLDREAPRAPLQPEQPVIDPLTGARYSVRPAGAGAEIAVVLGSESVSQKLDYEFGSGVHAYGYLSRGSDGTWIDARLNYYDKIRGWDFTSTQEDAEPHLVRQPLGRPQKPADVVRCFACHSTVVRADGLERSPEDGSGLRVRPDKSLLNVTCESCHGPRARHVRERREGQPVVTPAARSADQLNEVCGRCHGLSNIDQAHPVIARFQPWGLAQSRCFRASSGKLSCTSCHDPHSNARRDAAFYDAKCLGCHSRAQDPRPNLTTCPVNTRSGCVGCHMPSDSKSMPHVTFVDHRIRVVRKSEADRP